MNFTISHQFWNDRRYTMVTVTNNMKSHCNNALYLFKRIFVTPNLHVTLTYFIVYFFSEQKLPIQKLLVLLSEWLTFTLCCSETFAMTWPQKSSSWGSICNTIHFGPCLGYRTLLEACLPVNWFQLVNIVASTMRLGGSHGSSFQGIRG